MQLFIYFFSYFPFQVVGFDAVKIGQVLKATIVRYESNKAIVRVASNIEGEIPFFHLTNTAVQHPEKKYAVGSPVTTRVLQVVPERKHLTLTCKKLLVGCGEEIISDFDKSQEGTITTGFVVKVLPQGLLVSFFGDAKGFVPKSKVSHEKIDDLDSKFTIGNVVKCKVVFVKPEEKKMTLSLLLYEEDTPAHKVPTPDSNTPLKSKKDKKELHVGHLVSGTVFNVKKEDVRVKVKPANVIAKLPVSHLSDNKSKCKALKCLLSRGDQIQNVAVFSTSDNVVLSAKESICEWILNSGASSSETLEKSSSYPGVVSELSPSKVMVSVPIGKAGQSFLASSKLDEKEEATESSSQKTKANSKFSVGESVRVQCMGFDEDNQPVLCVCGVDKKEKHLHLRSLYENLRYHKLLQQGLLRMGLASKEFAELEVGNRLEVDIMYVTALGLCVKHEDYGIFGVVPETHLQPGVEYDVGLRVPVAVLHINVGERSAMFTARHDLVDQLHLQEFSQITAGEKVRCEVLLTQTDFALVRVKSRFKGLLAYIPPKKNFSIGQNISVIIKHVERKMVLGVSELQDKVKCLPVLPGIPSICLKLTEANNGQDFTAVPAVNGEEAAAEKIRSVLSTSLKQATKVITETKALGETNTKKEVKADETAKSKKADKVSVKQKKEVTGETKTSKKVKAEEKAKAKKETVNPMEGKKETAKSTEANQKTAKATKAKKKTAKSVEGKEDKTPTKQKREVEAENTDQGKNPKKKKKLTDSVPSSKKSSPKKVVKDEDGSDSGVDESMDVEERLPKVSKGQKPCLKLSSGFLWDVPENDDKEEAQSTDDEEEEDESKVGSLCFTFINLK